jgi:hypothetical protein
MQARSLLVLALGATSLFVSRTTLAQPETDKTKSDAKALLASGLRLFQAKDYLGALAVFRDAYARFPSTKILLNIATTLKQLGRNAEAANTYQLYLDARDTDTAKKADVANALAALDAKVGVLELTVVPPDAEVQLAGEDVWRSAAELVNSRVAPGKLVVRGRRDKYKPSELSGDVAAGKRVTMTLTLAPIPEATIVPAITSKPVSTVEVDEGADEPGLRARFGAYALAHIDIANSGGAARVAATFEVIPRLQAEVGAMIGPASGGYLGARYGFLPGRFRPVLAVGAPIFIADGARVALRGAAGLEVALSRHISIVAEAGVERVLNPGMNYVETVFVPAIGAAGRL